MTPRITFDEFDVEGNYGSGWEVVDTQPTWWAANRSLTEYDENEPQYGHKITHRRVRMDSVSEDYYKSHLKEVEEAKAREKEYRALVRSMLGSVCYNHANPHGERMWSVRNDIRSGCVLLNGVVTTDPTVIVRPGDVVYHCSYGIAYKKEK